MGWIAQSEDTNMPEWLAEVLPSTCKFCGAEKENFYNERQECTGRRCPNPECPGTIAQRIADMCVYLGIKGIKEGRGLQLVKDRRLRNHYEALPFLLEEKPKMFLTDFMRISFIKGIDTAWGTYCGKCNTLEELYEKSSVELKRTLDEYMPQLQEGLKYVELKPVEIQEFEPVLRGSVMMSGSIRGLVQRESLVYCLNKASKGLVDLRVVGKRKTGVLCLIQEADEPNRSKAECAIENGIPIMTPTEFVEWVKKEVSKRTMERSSKV